MRYDFHAHLGLELGDWLRGERDWRDLFDLADLLPDGSRYLSAVLSDRDIAEQIVDSEEAEEEIMGRRRPTAKNPPLTGYTAVLAKFDDVLDVLISLQATTAQADPRKAGRVSRPLTAVQIVRDERDSTRLNEFVDSLFKH